MWPTACATGGSALFRAYNSIKAGMFDVGIAVGFAKHERGAFRIDLQSHGLEECTARRAWP